jgi:uncharacterized protein YbbC (DUF1343 family)
MLYLGGMMVKTGLDVLLAEKLDLLRGRRVGLVTNPTGVTSDLESTVDVLHRAPGVQLAALFGPEHGFRASAPDGVAVTSGRDRRTGLPVHSLYGPTKKPTPEMLAGLDVLVFDLQDCGARFYTYTWTLRYSLEAAAENRLPLLVLDRPNPIGGEAVEGPVLDRRFASFVGDWPIPIRHGLTLGELATLFNRTIGADLTVVRMQGWRRAMWFDDTGLPWVLPSPNLPTLEAATVYPGTCLVEGTNLSEGRGTSRPFEFVGAPWVDDDDLALALNALRLPGVRFRPVVFMPTASKHSESTCGGVQVHVLDRQAFQPVATGVYLLATIQRLYPGDFRWLPTSWEGQPPHLDLLAGTDRLRQAIDAGVPVADILAEWQPGLAAFLQERAGVLLY